MSWDEIVASGNLKSINNAISRGQAPFKSGSKESADFIHKLLAG